MEGLAPTVETQSSSHVGALQDQLDTERRLLDELKRVLLAQREGVSSDDLAVLDDSLFSAQRILRTLKEARLRRRTLFSLMGVDMELSLRELDDALGPEMTEELDAARDAVLEAAAGVARELTVNQKVIGGALEVGKQLLRVFTGATESPKLYTQGSAPQEANASGALLNTRI